MVGFIMARRIIQKKLIRNDYILEKYLVCVCVFHLCKW
jgi:hypothetical protein